MSIARKMDFRTVTDRVGGSGFKKPVVVVASLALVGVLVFIALTAQFLMPYELDDIDLLHRYVPPVFAGGTWDHPLGNG